MFSVASVLLLVFVAQVATTALPIEAAADMDRDSDADSDIKIVCPLHSAHHKGIKSSTVITCTVDVIIPPCICKPRSRFYGSAHSLGGPSRRRRNRADRGAIAIVARADARFRFRT